MATLYIPVSAGYPYKITRNGINTQGMGCGRQGIVFYRFPILPCANRDLVERLSPSGSYAADYE